MELVYVPQSGGNEFCFFVGRCRLTTDAGVSLHSRSDFKQGLRYINAILELEWSPCRHGSGSFCSGCLVFQ